MSEGLPVPGVNNFHTACNSLTHCDLPVLDVKEALSQCVLTSYHDQADRVAALS